MNDQNPAAPMNTCFSSAAAGNPEQPQALQVEPPAEMAVAK
jgi:hypothetical protein